jgi:hypothetical protein
VRKIFLGIDSCIPPITIMVDAPVSMRAIANVTLDEHQARAEGALSFDNEDANCVIFDRDMIKAAENGGFTTIQGIGGIVARINEITADVAAAAEAQRAAASAIAGHMQQDASCI